MPALPPPPADITVNVSQISPESWTFVSKIPGLVSTDGAIDLRIPQYLGKTPVHIYFQIVSAAGIKAKFLPPPSLPPTVVIWNQKTTGPDCSAADKMEPDKSQGARIRYINDHNIDVKYGNHTSNPGKVNLKCNFYSLTLEVGDASTPPTLQTQDPVIHNGDGVVCTDSHGNILPCLIQPARRHLKRRA